MKLPASALVVFFFLSSLGISSTVAQSWPPQRPPACVPHRSAQPKPVPRTVNVTVPVPHKPPQGRFATYPCYPPAPPVSRPPASMPVQVQVSVQAAPPNDGRCPPLAYRDPGPIKPILQYGTALIGATVAAPFRLADMFLECRTRRACPPMVPVCQAPRCGPPVRKCAAPVPSCSFPAACAPAGPSTAPLPHPAGPSRCRPYLPPHMVREAELPPCEPRSLIRGLFNLPHRVMQRGRILGDLNSPYQCAPR